MTLAGVSCIMPVSRCRDILFSLIIRGSAGSRGQTWSWRHRQLQLGGGEPQPGPRPGVIVSIRNRAANEGYAKVREDFTITEKAPTRHYAKPALTHGK